MNLNLAVYFSAGVAGVPLVFVVIGLVWWLGETFQLTGAAKYTASLVTGWVCGALYMVSISAPPGFDGGWWAVFVYWFSTVMYGLGLGLLASLLWDTAKDLLNKVVNKHG
jgi:Na+/proline symporter